MRALFMVLAVTAACGFPPAVSAEETSGPVPKVREERPRLFVRAKAWDGPSVEKIRGWMVLPEYKAELATMADSRNAALYLFAGDEQAGKAAVADLKALKAPERTPGETPSYTEPEVTRAAMAYDWLHNHPDLDEVGRKKVVAYLEAWGGYYKDYLSSGCTPFYSRNNHALCGLTAVGLALYGDSPKANEYLAYAYKYLRENTGTIRQAEDGATGGSTYGLVSQFTANVNIVGMWRSATDWDAAKWIKEQQGNWLERQMLYQIWFTYPNGWLWKEGDTWSESHTDKQEHRMNIDAIAGMYQNGFGRAQALAMRERWKAITFYKDNRWMFFIYNDPDVKPRPLSELGRADVFSPNLHAYVSWRSSWEADATCVVFKAGDNIDHHGTWDTGKFEIFKGAPLAIKNGFYNSYLSPQHLYYKSPWSANVVIFDGPKSHGWQKHVPDLDTTTSWPTWKAARDKLLPVSGVLKTHEANDRFTRAVADLSGSTFPDNSTWIRELVFLGYKYLLVLDRVKPGPGVKTRWILHSIQEPKIEADKKLATIDNGKARLFCRTLLPDGARIEKVGGGGKAFFHKDQKGNEVSWDYKPGKPEQRLGAGRFDVVPADEDAECVYLHALFPTDTGTAAMPECSVEQRGADLVVKVGDLEYTLKPTK